MRFHNFERQSFVVKIFHITLCHSSTPQACSNTFGKINRSIKQVTWTSKEIFFVIFFMLFPRIFIKVTSCFCEYQKSKGYENKAIDSVLGLANENFIPSDKISSPQWSHSLFCFRYDYHRILSIINWYPLLREF